MFQLLRAIGLVAAVLLTSRIASAEVDVDSANFIMPGCRAYLAEVVPPEHRFAAAFCTGRIKKLVSISPDICVPHDVPVGQEVRVVVKYIDDRPARLHEEFRGLALEALRAAWPCKK